MAGFKSFIETGIGITKKTAHTGVAGEVTTLIGMSGANITENSIEVSVYLYKNSSSTEAFLVKNMIIPPGASSIMVGGNQKIVLEENDEIRIESDTATSVDVVMSVLETAQ